ncbi:MAG: endonuclease [Pseudomonas sp.]|uniref:endonuclease n=1 Tax=Pseudomonas sp. TaxID=306 RepID=UPI003396226E
MRVATAIALTCLTAWGAPVIGAGGQNRLSDPKVAVEQAFWTELYGAGGTSLYCGTPFTAATDSLTASRIYSVKQIKSAMRCSTDRQCAVMNPQYLYMLADLHNLYPALSRIETARRKAQFGELGDSVVSKFVESDCDLKTSVLWIEPRDGAKGNIARALFYMHTEYDLPLPGSLELFKAWNQLDPVDAEEKRRNERIEQLQGTRNRFIDDPAAAERLTP